MPPLPPLRELKKSSVINEELLRAVDADDDEEWAEAYDIHAPVQAGQVTNFQDDGGASQNDDLMLRPDSPPVQLEDIRRPPRGGARPGPHHKLRNEVFFNMQKRGSWYQKDLTPRFKGKEAKPARSLRWHEARVGSVPIGDTVLAVVEETHPDFFVGFVVRSHSPDEKKHRQWDSRVRAYCADAPGLLKVGDQVNVKILHLQSLPGVGQRIHVSTVEANPVWPQDDSEPLAKRSRASDPYAEAALNGM